MFKSSKICKQYLVLVVSISIPALCEAQSNHKTQSVSHLFPEQDHSDLTESDCASNMRVSDEITVTLASDDQASPMRHIAELACEQARSIHQATPENKEVIIRFSPHEDEKEEWLDRKESLIEEKLLTLDEPQSGEKAFVQSSLTVVKSASSLQDLQYSPQTGKEDFESGFPGTYWFVGDTNAAGGSVYWNDVNCFAGAGSWSAWCAGSITQAQCTVYPNSMDAYMFTECEYAGKTSNGKNKFYFGIWQEVQSCCDFTSVSVVGYTSCPGFAQVGNPSAEFSGNITGNTNGWKGYFVTLGSDFDTALYVRIFFFFHSDASEGYKGAYLDEIEFNNKADTAIYPISGGFSCTQKPDLAVSSVYFRTQPQNQGEIVESPSIGSSVYPHISYSFTPPQVSGILWTLDIDGTLLCGLNGSLTAQDNYLGWCNSPWVVTAGNHTLRGILDPAAAIQESNENNNIATKAFTVGAGSPDIRIAPISLSFSQGSQSKSSQLNQTIEPGSGTAVTANEIKPIDLTDPNADLGMIHPHEITVRFTDTLAGKIHAERISDYSLSRTTWSTLPGSASLTPLPPEVIAVRPSISGSQKAQKVLKENAPDISTRLSLAIPLTANQTATISNVLEDKAEKNGPLGVFYLKLAKEADPREISIELMQRSDVVYAHPSPICKLMGVPNDPLYNRMWNLDRIGMPAAWDHSGNTPSGVRVCVIDSGVRITHTELQQRTADPVDVYPDNGDAYGDANPDNDDTNGHGTACAGIIGAIRDNSTLVSGIAPVTIIPVNGYFEFENQVSILNHPDGIRWGVDHNASVISMSFGGHRAGSFEDEISAINYAQQHGVVLCAAAGNENQTADDVYPAAIPYCISVGAVDNNDERVTDPPWWWGSNYGNTVDVCAPGQGNVGANGDSILSLGKDTDTSYVNDFNGTSSATPQVAGLAGLLKHIKPSLTASEIRGIIESTADDQVGKPSEDTPGWDPYHGHGLIDVNGAVSSALGLGNTNQFTIYNDGYATLNVTSIQPQTAAPWLSWDPLPPFQIGAGESRVVTVTVNFDLLSSGQTNVRLLVASDDPDESPYPEGVNITATKNAALPTLTATRSNTPTSTPILTPTNTLTGPTRTPTPTWTGIPATTPTPTQTQPSTGIAQRDLPPCYIVGSPLTVLINLNLNPIPEVVLLEDQPPAGWSVSNISHNGIFSGGKVRWSFIQGLGNYPPPPQVTYQLTPAGSGGVVFTGTIAIPEQSTIGGDSTLSDQCPCMACDTNCDYSVSIGEAASSLVCWKNGICPIGQAAYCLSIWIQGGCYESTGVNQFHSIPCVSGSSSQHDLLAIANDVPPFASRDLPDCYVFGQPFDVFIAFDLGEPLPGVVLLEDQVPVGWTVSNISNEGSFASGKVRWSFVDGLGNYPPPSQVSYSITPATSNEVTFQGILATPEESGVVGDASISQCAASVENWAQY